MRWARAVWRLLRAVGHMVAGMLTILTVFPRLTPEQRQQRIQAWSVEMLACLSIKLIVKGTPPKTGPVMLVSNHISWLDITSLHAARFCRFVSKADVRRWPLIGFLAEGIGTLFIQRESRRDAMRVVYHMVESLREGDVLAVFPEGTTGDGVKLLPFHANLLQAAIATNGPVQPVALDYIDVKTGERSMAPCYVGDDTLLGSVWRTLTAPAIAVVITFGEPQLAQGRDRRTWALELRDQVTALRT
ncbi:MAG: 1-acyl-sn-glycerol-3-phosphate acyltransferase [Gammaproteobacteria bacterium]|nr:1-acyl-sn-glycerol-3-phosphate acyltransferase [Gammaproteobacteria bacterium]MBU0787549.1 1-acyl-sn-glycerol-3-phosphate acyltransferase [Gammaproteobacteria bacterium]MBU0814981.1 1-acyl-sn-glycerol-3-phosphate acyltransferase [Gammaproteobacteria bacterium]MBU1785911.1 1-acyl-sn-glycerol-3-phosphate acyltransferase [Gammaproteobacteria bacterium]